MIEALALRCPEPSVAFVHRRVSGIAADRGLPVPSYSSVRGIIGAIDPGLRTLAQHGDAAYRDQFELVFRRTTLNPNEQWQADHTLLDVAVLDQAGVPVRPWLTVVLDDFGDDEVQELSGEYRVEIGLFRQIFQPLDLRGFARKIGWREVVIGLETTDRLSVLEPLTQGKNEDRVEPVDAVAMLFEQGLGEGCGIAHAMVSGAGWRYR